MGTAHTGQSSSAPAGRASYDDQEVADCRRSPSLAAPRLRGLGGVQRSRAGGSPAALQRRDGWRGGGAAAQAPDVNRWSTRRWRFMSWPTRSHLGLSHSCAGSSSAGGSRTSFQHPGQRQNRTVPSSPRSIPGSDTGSGSGLQPGTCPGTALLSQTHVLRHRPPSIPPFALLPQPNGFEGLGGVHQVALADHHPPRQPVAPPMTMSTNTTAMTTRRSPIMPLAYSRSPAASRARCGSP
jgi:hypothetical protein